MFLDASQSSANREGRAASKRISLSGIIRSTSRYSRRSMAEVPRRPSPQGPARLTRSGRSESLQVQRKEEGMRARVWHGKEDIRCDTVTGPEIGHPRDAIVEVMPR